MNERSRSKASYVIPPVVVGVLISSGVYFSGASIAFSLAPLVVCLALAGVIYLVR